MLEKRFVQRGVVERVVEKSVGEKCCREVLEKRFVERGVVEKW